MRFFSVAGRIRRERKPVRFLLSRVLWKTRLCRLFRIQRKGYTLHFSPSAVAALLWVDPTAGRSEEAILDHYLSAGDLFIDVGANIGYLSMAAAALVGESGQVIAIEPHPRICQMLRANVALNRFTQVEVVQAALGSEVGQTAFASGRSDDQNHIIPVGGVTVPLTRLDVILGKPDRDIALLKIDVEGYEKFVLDGAGAWLQRTRVILFESFEPHFAHQGYSLDTIVTFLAREGFIVGKLDQLGNLIPQPAGYRSTQCENLLALNRRRFHASGEEYPC